MRIRDIERFKIFQAFQKGKVVVGKFPRIRFALNAFRQPIPHKRRLLPQVLHDGLLRLELHRETWNRLLQRRDSFILDGRPSQIDGTIRRGDACG